MLNDSTNSGCIRTLDSYAFSDCTKLTRVELGKNVAVIKNDAFSMCHGLKEIVLPTSITSIEEYAFFDCMSLATIVIPASVTEIGQYAFEQCIALTIYCEKESQPSGWSSNWNSSNRPVYWYRETKPTTSGKYWHYGENGEIVVW